MIRSVLLRQREPYTRASFTGYDPEATRRALEARVARALERGASRKATPQPTHTHDVRRPVKRAPKKPRRRFTAAQLRERNRDLLAGPGDVAEPPSGRPYPSWRSRIHEAGHAVAYLARGARVLKASGSNVWADPPEDAVAALAGGVAEQLAGFDIRDGGYSASDKAIARGVIGSSAPGWAWTQAQRQAAEILVLNWKAVLAVARALEHRDLSGSDLARIVASARASAEQEAWARYRAGLVWR